MEKRVLVTGATGFAGRYLCPYLKRNGYQVFGTSNLGGEIEGLEVPIYGADLCDYEIINDIIKEIVPTHVVHLAAISFIGHENVSQTYQTNIMGSRNILRSLSENGVTPASILLVSSANVYGISKNTMLSEDDAVNPVNDYAVSKVAMEMMAKQFSKLLNIVVARPFNYTGRGQSDNFLMPKIVNHFRNEAEFIELGNLDVSRDFSDIRTVVYYLKCLIESENAIGQTYNLCSGIATSLKQILSICEEISGRKLVIRQRSGLIRDNEVEVLVGNPEKLRREIGLGQTYSIRDTIEWMMSN